MPKFSNSLEHSKVVRKRCLSLYKGTMTYQKQERIERQARDTAMLLAHRSETLCENKPHGGIARHSILTY